jgi:hypothetical protein
VAVPADRLTAAWPSYLTAFDEILTTAGKRRYEPQHVEDDLLRAVITEKRARSIRYQIAMPSAVGKGY